MQKNVKIFLGLIGAIFIACGLLFILCPGGSLATVTKIAGVLMILSGIGTMLFFWVPGKILVFSGAGFVNGLITALFGVLFTNNAASVSRAFVIVYGLLLMAIGVLTTIGSILVRKIGDSSAWIAVLSFGVAAFVLGLVALTKPGVGNALLTIPVGIGLIAIGSGYIAIDRKMIQASKDGDDNKYYRDLT